MTFSGVTTPAQSEPISEWMKKYPKYLKTTGLLEPHHQIVLCHIQDSRWGGGSYPSLVNQSEFSTVPADWEKWMICIALIYNKM